MGEYGSDSDADASVIARGCAKLGIRRYRWVLYEEMGSYGVLDGNLNLIGARTPDAELRLDR